MPGRTICAKCRGPLSEKGKKAERRNRPVLDTGYYRDLFSPEALKRLAMLEAGLLDLSPGPSNPNIVEAAKKSNAARKRRGDG